MLHRSSLPAPARLFLPGCAVAAGLLLLAPRVQAAPSRPTSLPAMTLRVGKTATYPLPPLSTFTVEAGALNVFSQIKDGTLTIRALNTGSVRLRLETPGQKPRVIALQLVESASEASPVTGRVLSSPGATSPGFGTSTLSPASDDVFDALKKVTTRASSQFVDRAATAGAIPQRATPFQLLPPEFGVATSNTPTSASPTSEFPANPFPPQNIPPQILPPQNTTPAVELIPQGGLPATLNSPQNVAQPATSNVAIGVGAGSQLGTPLPPTPPLAVAPSVSATAPDTVIKTPVTMPVSNTATAAGGAKISSSLPAPIRGTKPNVTYKTTPRLPAGYNQMGAQFSMDVDQGLARLLTFQNNILSVFFSDPTAMDARAINARTIAVTGTGLGQSTLAVFTARYPGDTVGRATIYRVNTRSRGEGSFAAPRDSTMVENAIIAALGDPRLRVSVVTLPDKTLAARLTGVVRNEAEVQGALATAGLFAPRVLPSVYADPNAPSIEAVLSGASQQTPQTTLQANLRQITGNGSIELVALPGSLILKADVASQEDAQNLMQLLPSLNQPVVPFITIRGGAMAETSNVPLLQGEDLQLTQKLQAVTGVRTVYAVRASGTSIAIYGTVQDRAQFQAVKRYGTVIAQSSVPAAQPGASQGGAVLRPLGTEPALSAYDPTSGYLRQLGVQMFVRILDPAQSVIRNVTIETNIVEIARTDLKNLGAEYGSSTLTSENITPTSVTRTIDPTFNQGSTLIGNGFGGTGGLGAINPFRARINAIASNNNARILASPNIRATEGSVAQITIGGERPVPTASAAFGSTAQAIEFRRFGVILTMRPTVSDDNTIILQIRADVTQPDQTYAINVGGAIIPGESVRSIDTTITVRPGDIVVMGGLLSNEKRQQTSKVPILGDLPIIGALFRSKRFENNETELAIFMTPRIDALPATMDTLEIGARIPSFPALPGRQENNAGLFQAPRQVQ